MDQVIYCAGNASAAVWCNIICWSSGAPALRLRGGEVHGRCAVCADCSCLLLRICPALLAALLSAVPIQCKALHPPPAPVNTRALARFSKLLNR